jgi:hypothetical protein
MKFRFSSSIHYYITLTSVLLLAVGMPLNKIMMSVGAMLGVFNLLLERDFSTYYNNLKNNKAFLWLLAFFLLHVLGLIWTSDFGYAAKDIKIKLPLLGVPLALVARPIQKKHVQLALKLLITSLFITSLINFSSYYQLIGNRVYTDIREMSLFGSHIRYGILISLGVGSSLYLIKTTSRYKFLYLIAIIWFTIYTYYSQVISGALALIIVFTLYSLKWLFEKNKTVAYSFLGFLLIITITLFNFLKPEKSVAIDVAKLPIKTAEGNPYSNDLLNPQSENNQPVYISICDLELRREWNKISSMDYDDKDLKGQYIRYTIIRYLTSKNYSKDATGINRLKKGDIENIEKGIASIEEGKKGMIARLYSIRYQLNNNENPNGHSLLQRFEYWKTAIKIIKENWLIGVGTGDVQDSFNQQYEKDNSVLISSNRLRAHNMYLTVFVTFGVIGFVIFMGFLFYFFKQNFSSNRFLYFVALAVIAVTFLIEDTIETQLGVSIVSFFVALGLQDNKEELLGSIVNVGD